MHIEMLIGQHARYAALAVRERVSYEVAVCKEESIKSIYPRACMHA
jgi:hypothetical protein